MTAKEALQIARKIALTSLFTSYIATAFHHWQYNPAEWGDHGRGGFILTYVSTLTIYGMVVAFIHMFTEKQP